MGPHLLLRGDGRHGLFHEVRHGGPLRYVNGVTRRYFGYRRPSPMGNGALGCCRGIIRSSVVTMYQLGLVRQVGGHVGGELCVEFVPVQVQKTRPWAARSASAAAWCKAGQDVESPNRSGIEKHGSESRT